MNHIETARLAAAINMLRPDWPTSSLQTFLDQHFTGSRPFRDAAIALVWIACDPNSRTPKRVLEAGPWWHAVTLPDTPRPPHHGCTEHPQAATRIEPRTGHRSCAGCHTDQHAADQPYPLDRHGVAPQPDVRRQMLAAITSHVPTEPKRRTRPVEPEAMARARAELAGRAAETTTRSTSGEPAGMAATSTGATSEGGR